MFLFFYLETVFGLNFHFSTFFRSEEQSDHFINVMLFEFRYIFADPFTNNLLYDGVKVREQRLKTESESVILLRNVVFWVGLFELANVKLIILNTNKHTLIVKIAPMFP